ncbi:hypothetical protein J2Z37_003199 [Ammoniphilus resinae]|uniref:Uncharacterized protein n=1 Tax=Ammoniphilus resinae TaxID=861532 RepID=A0ABS4GSG8_9BACL|nr:hypothetical protein [Ammoniphilus resinae]
MLFQLSIPVAPENIVFGTDIIEKRMQEAIKQKMESKKPQRASGNPMTNFSTTHKMKSQQT